MTPSGQTVCLCMIVKNEAPVIRRCLDSVRPVIDRWLIVDTGSTDGTQAIVRAHFADLPGELVERPWVDFAANRTESLALARPLGDYTLIIDADDMLDVPAGFAMPDLDADSYSIDIAFAGVSYSRPQLVKAALPWRYEGVIHEFLACDEAKTSGHLPLILRINTDGARRRDPETYRRDALVLERAVATETDSMMKARYTFYLAQSYRDCGETEKALSFYLKRATMGHWDQEIFVSLYQAGKAMETLGRTREEVLAVYERASDACPTRIEALHAASRLCRLADAFAQGYAFAKRGVGVAPPPGGLFVERWIYDYGIDDEFAVNAYWAGHYRECLDASIRTLERGTAPPDDQRRFAKNARFAFDNLSRDGLSVTRPDVIPTAASDGAGGPFDLAAELGLGRRAMTIADVGAAFFGEKQLYQPLLDMDLATMLCFEPDPAQVATLTAHLAGSGLVIQTALGDGGEHTLHAAPGGMTSLFEPDQAGYDLFTLFAAPPFSPVATSVTCSPIRTRRLDDIAEVGPIDVLKIDIQGSERMVLRHGSTKLEACAVIQIEVPFVPLYKDAPTFGDLDAELRRQGFMVHGFATLKRLPLHPYPTGGPLTGINQLVDLDMVYIRDIRRMADVSSDTLLKMAMIADACYGSFDLAYRCIVELVDRGKLTGGLRKRYLEARVDGRRRGVWHLTPAV